MVGLWPGLWRGNGVVVLGSTVSAAGPAGCQAGKGVPGPAWSRTRKGKGWGQKGQSGARGGVTPGGRVPGSPRAGCALQPHCGLQSRAGGTTCCWIWPRTNNLLPLEKTAGLFSRRTGKWWSLFPLAMFQQGVAAALTHSGWMGAGSLSQDWHWLPRDETGLLPSCALALSPHFLLLPC